MGFDTESALRVDVNVRDDRAVLRWARRRRRILVCHDKHRDRATNQYLFPELYYRGGKVIRIHGSPEQDPLQALGKILLHRSKWLEFFKTYGRGVATVQMGDCRLKTGDQLFRVVQKDMSLVTEPGESLGSVVPKKRQKRAPKRRPPPLMQTTFDPGVIAGPNASVRQATD